MPNSLINKGIAEYYIEEAKSKAVLKVKLKVEREAELKFYKQFHCEIF